MNQRNWRVEKSVHREIGEQEQKHFSSFNDFLSEFIARGEVTSCKDLLFRRPDLLGLILFKWFRQGQIACIFAQRLAARPSAAGWDSVVITGDYDVDELSAVIEKRAETCNAIQLIFPGDGSANQCCKLIESLIAHEAWHCVNINWLPGEHGKSIQLGLRWSPPGRPYTSWVLGIAPFESMPFTRRFVGAPFIALVLRPSAPTKLAPTPKDESGREAAHLAHMDDQLGPDNEKRDKSTYFTRLAKAALLGSDLSSTARARVTFSLPPWCAERVHKILET